MIKDLIIKDNFFPDPQKIISLAKKQEYFSPSEKNNWVGMRSKPLNNILSSEDMQLILDPISNHVFHSTLDGGSEYEFQYKAKLYFHYLDENVKHAPDLFHKDGNSLMAGVVYLTQNPQDNSGTVIIENGNEHQVDNKFNRCVLYNSNLFHAPLNGFGKTVEDARLTLTIFFNEIHIAKPQIKGRYD